MNQWKKIIGMAMLLSASNAWGTIDVVNGFNGIFDVSFFNKDDNLKVVTGTSKGSRDWTAAEKAVALAALNYWDSIIYNTPGRNLSVAFMWSDVDSHSNSPNLINVPYTGSYDLHGKPYSETSAERVWKSGYSGTETGLFDYDVVIQFSSKLNMFSSLESGNTPSDQYDFYTAALHELGHSFGFATGTRWWFNNNDVNDVIAEYGSYTAFNLLTYVDGEYDENGDPLHIVYDVPPKANVAVQLGEKESTGILWRNDLLANFVHIKSRNGQDLPLLMKYSVGLGSVFECRELSSGELALMKEMGWAMEPLPVPEPASASLGLLGLSALLLRRRR